MIISTWEYWKRTPSNKLELKEKREKKSISEGLENFSKSSSAVQISSKE